MRYKKATLCAQEEREKHLQPIISYSIISFLMKMVSDIMSIYSTLEKVMSKVLKDFCLASHAK